MSLQSDLLDKRSKQLDTREQWIAEKEKLLDDASLSKHLEVLDKQIEIKESQLATLETRFTQQEDDYNKRKSDMAEELENLNARKLKKEHELKDSDTKLGILNTGLIEARRTLDTLGNEKKLSIKYLKEQEKAVDETIAEWNAQLSEFASEGRRLEEQKTDLLTDLIELEKSRQPVEEQRKEAEDKLESIEAVYQERMACCKKELDKVNAQIQSAKDTLKETELRNTAASKVLASRERSLNTRETALQTQELQLMTREKALNVKLGLSGIQI